MVKDILLRLDEELFFKLKKDKLRRETEAGEIIRWGEYIKILFGISKKT
jgi:hypothetical protein